MGQQVYLSTKEAKRGPRNYNGLSGFLAPDGVFHECAYQEHKDLAVRLVEKVTLTRYQIS
ncbi:MULTISPECIES: hypothetical protein [Paenibacillus]|uniref:hypothetical protein n=1 Tax=Paenibacillus TaxID=44249 RepID=UPI0003FF8F54|nr:MULTISPECIES: hypothetical protein [Paenibacillus]